MVDGRTARWAGHRDRRRAEFVAAAVAVIEREGPSPTVDQVAAELGATRQALYRQFGDRADLDRAVADYAATSLVEQLAPQLRAEDGLADGFEPAVRRVLTTYLDWVEGNLSLYRFVRAHEADPQPVETGAVHRVKSTVTDAVRTLARSALDPASDRPAALADLVAVGLVGMADAVIAAWLDEPSGLRREQVLDQLVQLLMGAIGAALHEAPPQRRR